MSDGIFAILPVRSLADGKSRLSPLLDAGERARLNEQLFAQTLDCLAAYPGAASTLVVERFGRGARSRATKRHGRRRRSPWRRPQ